MKKYNILFKTTFGVLLIFIGLLLLGSMKVSARELDIHKMLKSKQINVNEVTYGFLYASDFDMSQEYYISEAIHTIMEQQHMIHGLTLSTIET